MPADQATLDSIADKILIAEEARQAIPPISTEYQDLTVEDCYAAQDVYVAKKRSGRRQGCRL